MSESRVTRKGLELRADALWREIIRTRDRRCRRCGATPERAHMECAHGFPRTYSATKWDPANGFLLCWSCHVYFTRKPTEWKEQWKAWVGQAEFDRLDQLRTKYVLVNAAHLADVIDALKEVLKCNS